MRQQQLIPHSLLLVLCCLPSPDMEHLPCEIVRHIFSFISIDDRFRLRRVSKTFKTITEFHMKYVKRISSHRRAVYSPIHADCYFAEPEICRAACRPECLLILLKYCKSIECLFIGRIPVENDELIGKVYWSKPADNPAGPENCSSFVDEYFDAEERERLIFSDREVVWTEDLVTSAFDLMQEMDFLRCLSWIELEVRIPDSLKQKLDHIFCPTMFLSKGLVEHSPNMGPLLMRKLFFRIIEKGIRDENLQEIDYSDCLPFWGGFIYIERHGIIRQPDDVHRMPVRIWNLCFRSTTPMKICVRDFEHYGNVWMDGDVVDFTKAIHPLPRDAPALACHMKRHKAQLELAWSGMIVRYRHMVIQLDIWDAGKRKSASEFRYNHLPFLRFSSTDVCSSEGTRKDDEFRLFQYPIIKQCIIL
jgi:hypothetical protein